MRARGSRIAPARRTLSSIETTGHVLRLLFHMKKPRLNNGTVTPQVRGTGSISSPAT